MKVLGAKALWSNCKIRSSMLGIRFGSHASKRVILSRSILGLDSNIICENTISCAFI
jgi:hypothetical protein